MSRMRLKFIIGVISRRMRFAEFLYENFCREPSLDDRLIPLPIPDKGNAHDDHHHDENHDSDSDSDDSEQSKTVAWSPNNTIS